MKVSPGPNRYVIGGKEYTREEVIHKYLHLVKYVAGRISINLPPNVEINDLINDGIVGLIDAIEKYDDERGVKFETYAITRINGAILDALRALDWVPRAVRRWIPFLPSSGPSTRAVPGEVRMLDLSG